LSDAGGVEACRADLRAALDGVERRVNSLLRQRRRAGHDVFGHVRRDTDAAVNGAVNALCRPFEPFDNVGRGLAPRIERPAEG